MKNILLWAVLMCCLLSSVQSQDDTQWLRGTVATPDGQPLIGATITWQGTTIGTIADTLGQFKIQRKPPPAQLQVSFVGIQPILIEIADNDQDVLIEIADLPDAVLKEITIAAKKWDNAVSTIAIRNIETISNNELRKAPCCNLAESFETNNTVDVAYANPVTGVREVQMLGLRGTYSGFQIENRPAMKGIATPYSLELVPGTWLSSIQLSKGASTVRNGYEGIAGIINVELQKPMNDKPMFVNLFSSSGNRLEGNAHINRKGKKGFSNGLLLHASGQNSNFDHNNDNFHDMLNRHQLNGMYRMFMSGADWDAQLNVQALTDYRSGGQIKPSADGSLFGFNMQNDRVEVSGKFGKSSFGSNTKLQLGNIFGAYYHEASGKIGKNSYNAAQKTLYLQSLLQYAIRPEAHTIELIPTFSADMVIEKVNDTDLSRDEIVLGAALEYTFSSPKNNDEISPFVAVAGARIDHNSLFGALFTPRLNVKYNFTANTIVRGSAGKGYHSPYLIPENISWLATNRTLDIAQVTQPEEAWNYGLNFTHSFKLAGKPASLTLDGYYTRFQRLLLIDQETDPTRLRIYYTTKDASARTGMATFQWSPFAHFDMKLSYKAQASYATYRLPSSETPENSPRLQPMLPQQRGLMSLDYTLPTGGWKFHSSLQVVGPQRLPKNEGINIHELHGFPERTPTFGLVSAQVTKLWKKLEIYAGGENLTSYTQHQQIIYARDPQHPQFNASQAWAPSFGAMGYIGLRWWLDRKAEKICNEK